MSQSTVFPLTWPVASVDEQLTAPVCTDAEYRSFAIPAPPAVSRAPVVVDVDWVVSVDVIVVACIAPLAETFVAKMSPPTPTPPVTTRAPVVFEVEFVAPVTASVVVVSAVSHSTVFPLTWPLPVRDPQATAPAVVTEVPTTAPDEPRDVHVTAPVSRERECMDLATPSPQRSRWPRLPW